MTMENLAMSILFLSSILCANSSSSSNSIINPFFVSILAIFTFEILRRIVLNYLTDKYVTMFQIGLWGNKAPYLRLDISTIVQSSETSLLFNHNRKNNMLKNVVFALLSQPETWVFGYSKKELKKTGKFDTDQLSCVVSVDDNVKLLDECDGKVTEDGMDLIVVTIQVTSRGRGINLPMRIGDRESMKKALKFLHCMESGEMEDVDISWYSDVRLFVPEEGVR